MGRARLLSEEQLKRDYPLVHKHFFELTGYEHFKQVGLKLKNKHTLDNKQKLI